MAFCRKNHGIVVFNPHGLDSQPLVARSVRAADPLLCRLFPGRQPYRLVYTNAQPRLVPYRADFVYDSRFPAEDIPLATGRREPGGERGAIQAVARAGRDAAGWLAQGAKFPVYPGRYVMEFELDVRPAAETARAVALDIVDRRGAAVPAQSLTNGAAPALAFRIERVDEIEPRVYYRGGGDATFRGFHLREIPSSAP